MASTPSRNSSVVGSPTTGTMSDRVRPSSERVPSSPAGMQSRPGRSPDPGSAHDAEIGARVPSPAESRKCLVTAAAASPAAFSLPACTVMIAGRTSSRPGNSSRNRSSAMTDGESAGAPSSPAALTSSMPGAIAPRTPTSSTQATITAQALFFVPNAARRNDSYMGGTPFEINRVDISRAETETNVIDTPSITSPSTLGDPPSEAERCVAATTRPWGSAPLRRTPPRRPPPGPPRIRGPV